MYKLYMYIAFVQECDLSNKKVEVQATFLRSGQEKIAQLLNAQDAYEGRLKQADSEKQLLKVSVTSLHDIDLVVSS
jgi:hypothetical protein